MSLFPNQKFVTGTCPCVHDSYFLLDLNFVVHSGIVCFLSFFTLSAKSFIEFHIKGDTYSIAISTNIDIINVLNLNMRHCVSFSAQSSVT